MKRTILIVALFTIIVLLCLVYGFNNTKNSKLKTVKVADATITLWKIKK